MSIFNKAESHEIYKKAKEEYLKNIQNSYFGGICGVIFIAQNKLEDHTVNLFYHFPELKDIKPAQKKVYEFWWDKKNKGIRIRMFDRIINQTKPDGKKR